MTSLLDFVELDLIFKVKGGQKKLKNALYALYFLKTSKEFYQTCIDISLGDETELIGLW